MKLPYLRALGYGRRWLTGRPAVSVSEETIPSEDGSLEASVYRPRSGRAPRPGWVVLHGITRPGRSHESLTRFASSLAASGAVVVVPEVREWVELRLAPDRTLPVVRAGLDRLEADVEVTGPAGLAGFSFGSPQAVRAALDPHLAGRIGVVAAFGGYARLEPTLRFQLTGVHEWQGQPRRIRPDPYGRWVVAGNYLSAVPDHAGADSVASALGRLARIAGDRQIDSLDPALDPPKLALRSELDAAGRELFDYFAPPAAAGDPPDDERADYWVRQLSAAARRTDPDIELPSGRLRPHAPVHVFHGASDHLVPASEATALTARLADDRSRLTVTSLFAHSSEDAATAGSALHRVTENVRFFRSLERTLRSV